MASDSCGAAITGPWEVSHCPCHHHTASTWPGGTCVWPPTRPVPRYLEQLPGPVDSNWSLQEDEMSCGVAERGQDTDQVKGTVTCLRSSWRGTMGHKTLRLWSYRTSSKE